MHSSASCVRTLVMVFIVALSFAAAGCESVREVFDGIEKPTANVENVSLRALDLDGLTLAFDVGIHNPYTVDLPVAQLDLALASGGAQFFSGQSAQQGTVPAKGRRTFPAVARITFASLLSTLRNVRPGAIVPYAADIAIAVDAPMVGRLTLPLRREGEIPVPTPPDVSVQGIEWRTLSLSEASAVVRLDIGNLNDFPVDLEKLGYSLTLGTHKIATSSVTKPISFGAGEHETLEIPIAVKPIDLGMGALALLRSSSSSYRFEGTLAGRTPFGPLVFPVSKHGSTTQTAD
jgi:LEA14-like dessication related protein